jgi:phosphoribosyl 1,2-cyclic phosphodiesterase
LLIPPQEDGAEAETVLARMMAPPLFPIRPHQLRGSWRFGVLPEAAFGDDGWAVESFRVKAREIPHKGGRTVGYRISDGHSSLAYLPDHCPTEMGQGPDGWGAYHPAALDLAGDVDLLIHDAHLFPEELAAEASFGHAAADYAVGLGARAGARQVALFHHKPDRHDDALDRLVARCASMGEAASPAVTVRGAFDGLELDL